MTAPVLEFKPESANAFAREVMERSGQNVFACYQCRRCAAGCPVAEETGFITPDRLVRMVVLGDKGAALENDLVWRCVSCYTCGTRCPNDIMTGRITETLKKMAKEEHREILRPRVAHFHDSFMGSALRWGRVNELEMMGFYEMKNFFSDVKRGAYKAIVDELISQAKNFGLPMLKAKRMHVGFARSKGTSEIKGLMKKAEQKKKAHK